MTRIKYLAVGAVAFAALALGGVASAEGNQEPRPPTRAERLANINAVFVRSFCFWVESGRNTPDTAWDMKFVRAYTVNKKICLLPGRRGFRGRAGARGAQGIAGITGQPGAQGLPGATGATGATGPAGPQGLPGDGIPGPQGPAGPAGPKGDTGAQGPVGPAGLTGPPGPKGDTGATGAVGPAGPAGVAGPAGPPGPAGPAGPQGPKGDPGEIGAIETVVGTFVQGEKTITVNCPAGKHAISGGYNIQGSVTASYRSDSAGLDTGTTSWTVTQTSGNTGSGKAYVYCA